MAVENYNQDEEIFNRIISEIKDGKNIILHSPGGTGKCLDPDTKVLMSDGSIKRAYQIIKGDFLMGDDSTPRVVQSITSGVEEMFEITTSLGDSYIVNKSHILSLRKPLEIKVDFDTKKFRVFWYPEEQVRCQLFHISEYGNFEKTQMEVKKFIDELYYSSETIDVPLKHLLNSKTISESYREYLTFKVKVQFQDTDCHFHPYYIGLKIGEGKGNSSPPEITFPPEVNFSLEVTSPPEVRKWLEDYLLEVGDLDFEFQDEGIPKEYLLGNEEDRLSLLAGIIDSAGEVKGFRNKFYLVKLQNKRLAKDLIFLSRSLGFSSYISSSENEVKIFGDVLCHIPVLIPSKKLSFSEKFRNSNFMTYRIKSLGEGKYCGFTLNGNGRFVLGNFIVTHNTFTLCKIVEELTVTVKNLNISCTALTGVAAVNLNVNLAQISGTTLHRWAGVGLAKKSKEQLLGEVLSKLDPTERWLSTDILIIDEVSMLGSDLLEKLDYIGRGIREDTASLPFGGIQLILSGDFLQLPPVEENWCFKSRVWKELNLIPFLFDKPKRYDDHSYFEFLLRVREGCPTDEDFKKIKARIYAHAKYLKAFSEMKKEEAIRPTILFSRRADVGSYNEKELEKLEGEVMLYEADDTFISYNSRGKEEYYTPKLDDAIPKVLPLKVGAQVMLKYNLDVSAGLVNGSRGVIMKLLPKSVYVRFINGYKKHIKYYAWVVEDANGSATRNQLPFILAWACTIHKAQGCTLDYAICDLGSTIFAPGQAYVALSRVRNWKGLFISSFNPKSISVDKVALYQVKELKKKSLIYEENKKKVEEIKKVDIVSILKSEISPILNFTPEEQDDNTNDELYILYEGERQKRIEKTCKCGKTELIHPKIKGYTVDNYSCRNCKPEIKFVIFEWKEDLLIWDVLKDKDILQGDHSCCKKCLNDFPDEPEYIIIPSIGKTLDEEYFVKLWEKSNNTINPHTGRKLQGHTKTWHDCQKEYDDITNRTDSGRLSEQYYKKEIDKYESKLKSILCNCEYITKSIYSRYGFNYITKPTPPYECHCSTCENWGGCSASRGRDGSGIISWK